VVEFGESGVDEMALSEKAAEINAATHRMLDEQGGEPFTDERIETLALELAEDVVRLPTTK
jgi:hypothetical protein